eukprot:Sdes_comp20236_c0_seq3m13628
MVPVLIVGTKLDLIRSAKDLHKIERKSTIATDIGSESINLNTLSLSDLDSPQVSFKINSFLDKVVTESKRSQLEGRRKLVNSSSLLTPEIHPSSTPSNSSPLGSPVMWIQSNKRRSGGGYYRNSSHLLPP